MGIHPVKKTVVVVCEGTTTEPQYIEALAAEPEVRHVAAVDLRLEAADEGEVPLTLVRRAIAIERRAKKEGGEVDEIWCVFDVEWPRNHPNLREAMTLAESNGIHLAVSNPCFEIWLILHFKDAAGFLLNDEVRRERRGCDSQTGKHLDPQIYMPRRAAAVERAARLDAMHKRNGTVFSHDNPS